MAETPSDLTRHLICPPEVSRRDQMQLALDLQAMLFADAGAAWWREGYETYTCQLGILHGGCN